MSRRIRMRNVEQSEPAAATIGAERRVEVINGKAVAIGALVTALLVAGMFAWRFAAKIQPVKKLVEFQFSVEEPEKEEFELQEPMRDIVREQTDVMENVVEVQERPDIRVTVVPTEIDVMEEVVQTKNIEVQAPEIEIEARDVDVDAPEQIVEASENVEFAVDVIAASVEGPADVFDYDEPNPPDKPLLFAWNRAPRPSRTPKALPQAFGDQDAPAIGELGPMSVNLFGSGDFFRSMTRAGGLHARSSVDSALHWLAAHQEADGHWDPVKYGGSDCPVGVSGLSLLAFMGGGHTTRRGEYRRQVLKGMEWLLSRQKPDGRVGNTMYEHAIATIAFCEALGRAQDERMASAARKGVVWIERVQLSDGGWRYQPDSQVSDVSVTAWVIQALKAARLANVKFNPRIYAESLLFVDAVTDKGAGPDSSGAVGYTYDAAQNYPNNPYPAMTCAGMVIRQFSGIGVKSPVLIKGAALTRQAPPDWNRKNFYLWYYATYAMHNMGDENRVWWNKRIRDVLLAHQARDGDNAGSWDPKNDAWGGSGGRVYTTAAGALCLEVYYRYSDALSSFGMAPDIDDLFTQ